MSLPTALVLWSQHEPLPSPAEGAALLVEAATGREHSGVTADCRVLGGDDPVLGCGADHRVRLTVTPRP